MAAATTTSKSVSTPTSATTRCTTTSTPTRSPSVSLRLLNNLFGRGKEPFWQQAYTNLVKFVILLHKVAYDYVTLFNVYECAISPPLLDQTNSGGGRDRHGPALCCRHYRLFGERAADLQAWLPASIARRPLRRRSNARTARVATDRKGISFEPRSVLDPAYADPDKLAQLEAVKRWFTEDWRRIEPKLRTSIVEGISVFLSLFDDNPKVKSVFCPTNGSATTRKKTLGISMETASFILLADRARQGLRTQLSYRHESRTRQSHRGHDEARFRTGRAESRAANRSQPRQTFSPGSVSFATNTSTSQP